MVRTDVSLLSEVLPWDVLASMALGRRVLASMALGWRVLASMALACGLLGLVVVLWLVVVFNYAVGCHHC